MGQYFFIHDQFATEIITEQWLGDVIGCRTQSPRDDNNIRFPAFFIKSIPDPDIIISNSHTAAHPDPDIVQFPGDKG